MVAAAPPACVSRSVPAIHNIPNSNPGGPFSAFLIAKRISRFSCTQPFRSAAATIVKSWEKWNFKGLWLQRPKNFIVFLGLRYCPIEVSVLGNENWVKNVTYWYEKFKGKEDEL